MPEKSQKRARKRPARDARGHFLPGHGAPGPGRPAGQPTIRDYRSAAREALPPEALAQVVHRLVSSALSGSVRAAEAIIKLILGSATAERGLVVDLDPGDAAETDGIGILLPGGAHLDLPTSLGLSEMNRIARACYEVLEREPPASKAEQPPADGRKES